MLFPNIFMIGAGAAMEACKFDVYMVADANRFLNF